MAETHSIPGGKIHVYRRRESQIWQCSTYLAGKNRRVSTKQRSLAQSKDFAEDWYLGLRGKVASGEVLSERTFADAATQFQNEYEILTDRERNQSWVQEYRVSRMKPEDGKRVPSRRTLHHEVVTLRLVLKTAVRYQWPSHEPDISAPYKGDMPSVPNEFSTFLFDGASLTQEPCGEACENLLVQNSGNRYIFRP